MKTNCRGYRKLLSLDMDGEIAGEDRDRLRTHLETCAGCRTEHRLWLRIRDVIREEETAGDGSVALRVLEGLRERREASDRLLPFVRRVATAAAVLVLASTAVLFALGPQQSPPTRTVAPVASDLARSIILDHAGDAALRLVADERGTSK